MSRFVWGGSLYGNLEEDPEPEPQQQIVQPNFTYQCPACGMGLSATQLQGLQELVYQHVLWHEQVAHRKTTVQVQRDQLKPAPAVPQLPAGKPIELKYNPKTGNYE